MTDYVLAALFGVGVVLVLGGLVWLLSTPGGWWRR